MSSSKKQFLRNDVDVCAENNVDKKKMTADG